MNKKKGKCIDCPPKSPETYIIAKRCEKHYKKHRQKENAKKPAAIAKAAVKKEHKIYFTNEILKMPPKCEECGNPLVFSQPWMARAAICHILGKAQFPSVATHSQNKFFGCITCHADYDNRGSQHVVKMKMLPKLKERVKTFLHLLTPDEMRKVPDYFLN